MSKQEALKQKFGGILDTDALVAELGELLTEYNHRNTPEGIATIVYNSLNAKQHLIEMFTKSKYYAGDLRIIIPIEMERDFDTNAVRDCLNGFPNKIGATKLRSRKDNDGFSQKDYLRQGKLFYTIDELADEDTMAYAKSLYNKITQFDGKGYYTASDSKYNAFLTIIELFANCSDTTVTETFAVTVNQYIPDITQRRQINAGMKISRALNRVCEDFGLVPKRSTKPNGDKEPYFSEFARYSDFVNCSKIKRQFVLSLNPYDFLTSSFGTSWTSCHTIDKTNKRRCRANGYSGMHCSGNVSYALDDCTFITYVLDARDTYKDGKIYRNLFHWNGIHLMQSRVYPQGNDGATDLYKKFRLWVEQAFDDMLGLTIGANWKAAVKGRGNCYTRETGTHYHDRENFDCYTTRLKSQEDVESYMNIGRNPICPHCGEEHSIRDQVSHSGCPRMERSDSFQTLSEYDVSWLAV